MNRLATDVVSLVKLSGQREDNLPAVVLARQIILDAAALAIEEGDHIHRTLPNGVFEDYLVLEATFYSKQPHGHINAFYELTVRKQASLLNKGASTHIGTVIHGNVMDSNIQSAGSTSGGLSQSITNTGISSKDVEQLFVNLVDIVKSQLAPEELSEYSHAADELKATILQGKRPDESALKRLLRSLSLLDATNGSIDLISKIWPVIQIILSWMPALPK